MNSHYLVPDGRVYPWVQTETIKPFTYNTSNYRPTGNVNNIERHTFQTITSANGVSVVYPTKFVKTMERINPTVNFRAF